MENRLYTFGVSSEQCLRSHFDYTLLYLVESIVSRYDANQMDERQVHCSNINKFSKFLSAKYFQLITQIATHSHRLDITFLKKMLRFETSEERKKNRMHFLFVSPSRNLIEVINWHSIVQKTSCFRTMKYSKIALGILY